MFHDVSIWMLWACGLYSRHMGKPPYAHPLALERLADASRGGCMNMLDAAIAIASNDDLTFQPRSIHQQFEWMTRDLRILLDHDNPVIPSVRHILFDRYAYAGDHGSHPAPAFLLMQHVMARRLGSSIMISLLCAELARRGGARAYGVMLPGRFLVAIEASGEDKVFIEPTMGGKMLTRDECRQLVIDSGVLWRDEDVVVVSDFSWILRIIRILADAYAETGDLAQRAAMLEMSLVLGDDSHREALRNAYAELARKAARRN